MSHRSKVFLWSQDADRSANVEQVLDHQGVALNHLEKTACTDVSFANSGADALILDFKTGDPISENDFLSLWSAAQEENLKVIYLADSQDTLPAFAPRDDDAVQILVGPALEQQLVSRLRLMTRLETMAEEIQRRSTTLNAFGVDTPYDISAFEQKSSNALVVAEPSTDFIAIERALSYKENKVVGAFTKQMAMEYLEEYNFNLILFEVTDDRAALFDFIASVRLDSRFFNIPLLILGTDEQIGNPEEVYSAGATEIAYKPIVETTLTNTSKALIREHHYHRHLSSIYYSVDQDSVQDEQTGLFRFGFLMDHLTAQVEQAAATDTSLSVAFFDILNLDAINREFGYAAGDSLIRQVGSMISRFFRGEDLCARYGGDEFVVIMPRTRIAEATPAVRRLVSTINATQFQIQSGKPPINFSLTFGQAEYELDDTAQTILARARQATHRN